MLTKILTAYCKFMLIAIGCLSLINHIREDKLVVGLVILNICLILAFVRLKSFYIYKIVTCNMKVQEFQNVILVSEDFIDTNEIDDEKMDYFINMLKERQIYKEENTVLKIVYIGKKTTLSLL